MKIPLVTMEEANRLLSDHAEREDALKDLVGRMIQQYRLTFNPGNRLTRKHMAGMLGVTPQTLYNWERGAILPAPGKFNRLVEILIAPGGKHAKIGTTNQQPTTKEEEQP